jgi:hypothetical protein
VLPQAQLEAGPAEHFPENTDIVKQSASQVRVHDDVPDDSDTEEGFVPMFQCPGVTFCGR